MAPTKREPSPSSLNGLVEPIFECQLSRYRFVLKIHKITLSALLWLEVDTTNRCLTQHPFEVEHVIKAIYHASEQLNPKVSSR